MSDKPDYRISAPTVFTDQEGKEKTFWNGLGVGFKGSDGNITLKMKAHPIGDTIVLFPWSEKENAQPSA